MSFNWSEYLEVAFELQASAVAGKPLEQGRLRAAISRSYYALFCAARNHLRMRRPWIAIPSTGQAHIIVKNTFEGDSDPDYVSIGITLGRLKKNRGKADYDDTVTGLSSLADITLMEAIDAMDTLKSL